MSELIQKITQIGIVTSDAKAMMERYEKIYGIKDWVFVDGSQGMDPKYKAKNLCTRGVPGDFAITLAQAMVGDVQLELIQPLDDISDYARFLKEHGDGVHHIEIVTDYPKYSKVMKERGIPEVLRGTVPGVNTFVYFDTEKELGMITETHDWDNK